jgi:hypothetical protein
MKARLIASSIGAVAIGIALLSMMPASAQGQAPAGSGVKTPWGDPDLQGIWNDPYDTPLQRSAQYANQEFFTDAQIAELDRVRANIPRREYRDKDASGKGTEQDVAGAYNAVFESHRPTGKRTSLVVDPPNGRVPALTPETQKRQAEYRQFQLALMQNTNTCKIGAPSCRGGKYGPPSPLRNEVSPSYNVDRLNRSDGPEDRGMPERCMGSALPDFSGYRRIVQGPGAVSMFYDVGQGQGWERIVPITNAPHLPKDFRRWWGDSRGRWEGNTLVVDVTNFTPKVDFRGARENLHLIERWTRLDADTLRYEVRIEDPTTWVAPWTVRYDLKKQDDKLNRIYYEPRCSDTNFGLAGMLANSRAEERLFAEGKGPDPASRDIATGGAGGGEDNRDPLAGGE